MMDKDEKYTLTITEANEKAEVETHRTTGVIHQERRPEFGEFPPGGKIPDGVFRGRCFINAIGWLSHFELEKGRAISDTTTSHTLLYLDWLAIQHIR